MGGSVDFWKLQMIGICRDTEHLMDVRNDEISSTVMYRLHFPLLVKASSIHSKKFPPECLVGFDVLRHSTVDDACTILAGKVFFGVEHLV